jgi:hypothetical protein
MSANTAIDPTKKTYAAVNWAVQKVNLVHAYAIQKMGGVLAVTGVILAAVKAYVWNTVGKAMEWIEDRLAAGVTIVIGFLAAFVGFPEKSVLRKVLELLT